MTVCQKPFFQGPVGKNPSRLCSSRWKWMTSASATWCHAAAGSSKKRGISQTCHGGMEHDALKKCQMAKKMFKQMPSIFIWSENFWLLTNCYFLVIHISLKKITMMNYFYITLQNVLLAAFACSSGPGLWFFCSQNPPFLRINPTSVPACTASKISSSFSTHKSCQSWGFGESTPLDSINQVRSLSASECLCILFSGRTVKSDTLKHRRKHHLLLQ